MKHMAEYLLPGSFFPEPTTRELPERSVDAALMLAPDNAYCFTLYDVEEAPDLGPDFKVSPVPKNRSSRYYFAGQLYNLEELEVLGGHDILAANMRANHWEQVIHCVTGNWQPFEPGDVLVDA